MSHLEIILLMEMDPIFNNINLIYIKVNSIKLIFSINK